MPQYSEIKLKRTEKTLSQVSSVSLASGEPLFVDSNEGAFLVVGKVDGGSTVTNSKVLAFTTPSLAESQVYFEETSPGSGVYKLVDQAGNDIEFSGISPLTFQVDGGSNVVFSGETAVTVTPNDIGAVALADKSPDSYNSSTANAKVSTVGFTKGLVNLVTSRGYLVATELPASSATPLEWNTEYRLGEIAGTNTISITLPTVETTSSAEIRLCFYCGDNLGINITTQTGMELIGAEAVTALNTGCYCEISLCYVGSYNSKDWVSVICNNVVLS